MKRLYSLVIAAVMVMAFSLSASAQNLPQNYKNMFFFVSGCSSFTPQTPQPATGAVCFDTGSGAQYFWNGTAFAPAGAEVWTSNGGAGQTSATTTFFSAQGNSTNNTTEAATMELAVPFAAVARNLHCYVSAAPGAAKSDTFTIRSSTSLGGSMANGAVTCQILGASATSCTDGTDSLTLAAGSVMDLEDTSVGTGITARTLACAFEVDDQ